MRHVDDYITDDEHNCALLAATPSEIRNAIEKLKVLQESEPIYEGIIEEYEARIRQLETGLVKPKQLKPSNYTTEYNKLMTFMGGLK